MIAEILTYEGIEPRPKLRARVTRYGTFTPRETRLYENTLRAMTRQQWSRAPITGPVRVDIELTVNTPRSWSKKRREAALHRVVGHRQLRQSPDGFLERHRL